MTITGSNILNMESMQEITKQLRNEYDRLLEENNLNPLLYEPVVEWGLDGLNTSVRIGVKPIDFMKHLDFED